MTDFPGEHIAFWQRSRWLRATLLLSCTLGGCAAQPGPAAGASPADYEAYWTDVFRSECRQAGHVDGEPGFTACMTGKWALQDALHPQRRLPSIASYRRHAPPAAGSSRPVLTRGARVIGQ